VLPSSSGVEDLIPPTGTDGLDWIADVDDASGAFFAGGLAILRTGALPRWLGWLGLVVGIFAGWLGLLGLASDVIEGISVLGFIGFFVFMLAVGIALLRRGQGAAAV
jgi:hypothetical protein